MSLDTKTVASHLALATICNIARLHNVGAEPAVLAHQLGISLGASLSQAEMLRAFAALGLKAKLVHTSLDRLATTPLPAIAFCRVGGKLHAAILAKVDGSRVLLQVMYPASDAQSMEGAGQLPPIAPSSRATADATPRTTIESLETFVSKWTGELLLVASRNNLANALAQFDFAWFIPSLVSAPVPAFGSAAHCLFSGAQSG